MKIKNAAAECGRELSSDKGMALSLMYVLLPVLLFFIGWLKFPLAVLLCGVLLCFLKPLSRSLCVKRPGVGISSNPEYWLTLAVVVFIWVMFSGIGGFSFQNTDYYVRNPVYRDLVNQPWPVCFDLSTQRQAVQEIVGSDTVAFTYYFCFWLPPALLSKLLPGGELVSGLLLLGWAYLGVMLVLYQIHRYLRRTSWVIPGIFIFFGGLDAVGYRILNGEFPLGEHLEWWCTYFQYSSHTTVLYWVFNQTIPVWLLTALFLNMRGNRSTAGLASLMFAYSPFATLGMVPLAVCSVFRKKQKWKQAVTWENVVIPLVMLLVLGSFYLSNPDNLSVKGWIFEFFPAGSVMGRWLLFLFLEVGVYALILRKYIFRYEYLWLVLAELILIPLYRMTGANDFAMRASLPGLFLLSVCLIRCVLNMTVKWEKWAVLLILTVAAATPLSEIYRSASATVLGGAEPNELVYSFQDFATDDAGVIEICRQQFFTYHPEDKFFFRYLGRVEK